jgi:hypothetical protein
MEEPPPLIAARRLKKKHTQTTFSMLVGPASPDGLIQR